MTQGQGHISITKVTDVEASALSASCFDLSYHFCGKTKPQSIEKYMLLFCLNNYLHVCVLANPFKYVIIWKYLINTIYCITWPESYHKVLVQPLQLEQGINQFTPLPESISLWLFAQQIAWFEQCTNPVKSTGVYCIQRKHSQLLQTY